MTNHKQASEFAERRRDFDTIIGERARTEALIDLLRTVPLDAELRNFVVQTTQRLLDGAPELQHRIYQELAAVASTGTVE